MCHLICVTASALCCPEGRSCLEDGIVVLRIGTLHTHCVGKLLNATTCFSDIHQHFYFLI